jgi:hypothetical protein
MTSLRTRNIVRLAQATAFALVLGAGVASADPDAQAQREIDHLLEFIGTSSCTFVRNGEAHPAADAREHLASKLRYTRGRIGTADEFIRYLATSSSTSGEPYKIICGGKEGPAGAWLSSELDRYRKATAQRASGAPAR